jgi:hypothetical protein
MKHNVETTKEEKRREEFDHIPLSHKNKERNITR